MKRFRDHGRAIFVFATIAAAAVVVGLTGCDLGPEPNLDRGQQLFTQKCGTCHTLTGAGTSGTVGPNLDYAFKQARASGMDPDTFEGVTKMQVEHPRPADPRQTDVYMPAKLVEGDELISPLFPGGVNQEHRDHVILWWSEVFGGPSAYTEQLGGYHRMVTRHKDLAITPEQRLRFATLMSPFLITINNHTLGTCSALFALYFAAKVWTEERPGRLAYFLAGFFAMFTVCNELPALAFAAMQACLFAFIYVLIDLETYSLLIGALALSAVVSALMFLTQRVDWSAQPLIFLK